MKSLHTIKLVALVLLATAIAIPDAEAQRQRRGDAEKESQYPEATREEPEGKYTQRLMRQIERMQKAYNTDGQEEQAIEAAEEILASERAKPYDRGIALLLAGSSAVNLGDDDRAISYLTRAIEENQLSNDNHYTAMLSLASVYTNADQLDKALPLLERVIAETKTTNPDVYALQANALYNSDRYADAIAPIKRALELQGAEADPALNQMLMASYSELGQDGEAVRAAEELHRAKPDDRSALLNLALMYNNAEMQDKAVALLDGARERGMFKDATDYQRLSTQYLSMERHTEAAAVMEEGMAKGILPENGENYFLLAQAYYFGENIPAAITAAQKAGPLAKDGESFLFLAQVLDQEDRSEEAKAAARQAIDKGLASPGSAWMVMARSEFYTDNIPGAQAAYREAMKDPKTREQAQSALAQISR